MQPIRVFFITAGALVWLTGCSSTTLSDLFKTGNGTEANASADAQPTGTVATVIGEGETSNAGLLGSDPKDDLSLGKQHFRQENYGLAEHYFRRAAESHPRDAEAWIGLAAAYDRLRRFDLADRAYKQAIAIMGPDGRGAQQPGLLLHAARRLCPRPHQAGGSPRARSKEPLHPEQPQVAGGELPQGQGHPVARDQRKVGTGFAPDRAPLY